MRHYVVGLTLALSLLVFLLAAGAPRAQDVVENQIIVKLRDSGSHAIDECAQALHERGRTTASASAAGSDSLDQLHREFGVRRVRAMFRRADDTPLTQQRARIRRRFGAQRDLAHVYLIDLRPGASAWAAAARYAADAHVEYAQPNFKVQADAFVPDDPFFFSSGSWGQDFADLWGVFAVDAPGAWARTTGEGVVVAVVDTGVDYDHPDIAANIWINPGEDLNGNDRWDESDENGIDDDDNGLVDDIRGFDFDGSEDGDGDGRFDGPDDESDNDPFDDFGHGTHVSGTIAAVGGNGIGIVGVAPRARIMAVKGLDRNGSGDIANLAKGIAYAARMGASVVNNSWSCGRCPSNPVAEDALRLAEELDTVVMFSAGNKAADMVSISPQNQPESFVVAAHDEFDAPTSFSSRGYLVDSTGPGGGSAVPGLVVPSRNVLSLLSSGASPGFSLQGLMRLDERYVRLAGTSMSTPHAVGVAALVRAAHPQLSAAEVRRLLRLTADDLGDPGHDPRHGAGRVNAARAVARGQVPDAVLQIAKPGPADVVSQVQGVLDIVGEVRGADLRGYELSQGAGLEPNAFVEINSGSGPIDDASLGVWDIEELPDGAHVLRLRGETPDGELLDSYQVFTLERNRPTPVSPEGPFAFPWGVDGDFVLWSSRRDGVDENGQTRFGVNLFLTDLRDGTLHGIRVGHRDVADAEISGRRVVWTEIDRQLGPNSRPKQIMHFTCLFEPRTGRCPMTPLLGMNTPGADRPRVFGDRVYWMDATDQDYEIFTCTVNRETGACPVKPLVTHPGTQQVLPFYDGKHLVWDDDRGGGLFEIFYCELDADPDATCEPRRVQTDRFLPISPRISGDLLAFIEFKAPPTPIVICQLDFETGACPEIEATARDFTAEFDLDGDRLIWDNDPADTNLDIYFCEFDRHTQTCPPQRITGELSRQLEPLLDKDRAVFLDERDGPFAVSLFELPRLERIGNRQVRAGRWVGFPVRGRDPTFGLVSLRAELADGGSIGDLGARFFDFGSGFGFFFWRPGLDQVGSHDLRFTAESAGRLTSDRTMRIRVRRTRGHR